MQAQFQNDPQGAQIQIASMVARRISELTMELAQAESMGQQKDPLVALKERELDLKAVDLQRKAEQDFNGNEIRENETDERIDLEKMKLENNEDQAAERIKVAREKIEIQRKRAAQQGRK